jgi:peptidoglycan hydrolase-like protein with peptidoglycan-binding domain
MFIAQAPATAPATATVSMPAALVEQITCPVVTQMIKYGAENPLKDVSNLQRVLNAYEQAGVPVTGDYDEQTRDAVVAFQKKYAPEILGPWGASAQPTGIVSLTTAKKLDQIACQKQLTLNEREMKFISVVGAKALQAADPGAAADGSTAYAGPQRTYTFSTSASTGQSSADSQTDPGQAQPKYYPYDTDAMTASAASGSIAERFVAYLKGLFR